MTENMESSLEPVSVEIKRKVAYITVNTKMNTFNYELIAKFLEILQAAEQNPKVGCVVIKSTGEKVFSGLMTSSSRG